MRFISPILGFFICAAWANAQTETEIYLFDLSTDRGRPLLSNPKNISNNGGYDNQPSFLDDHTVLFSSNHGGQTDVLRFNITEGSTSQWLTNTQTGSEYSPLKIPGKQAISAIRLDLDGLQRLYEYPLDEGESTMISHLKIGYHLWVDKQLLMATVLMDDRMDLVAIDPMEGSHRTVARNVGRSLHSIPGDRRVSYISKAKKIWEIMAYDPLTGESEKLADCHKNQEDINWLDKNTLITGWGKKLLTKAVDSTAPWRTAMEFGQDQINNISRIAINPSKDRLAFVAEESPAIPVQRQQDALNLGNLEDFIAQYDPGVVVQRYPDLVLHKGKTALLEAHERLLANTERIGVEGVKRMIAGHWVIDEEIVTVDGKEAHQVALYEIKNGRIASKFLIFPDLPTADSQTVVKELLQAHNQKDFEGFMENIAEEAEMFEFPAKSLARGKTAIRQFYTAFLDGHPDPYCELLDRIVIGNKILDRYRVGADQNEERAVVLYEVEEGKITKVRFIE